MNLEGWIPSCFFWAEDGPRVQWTLLGRKRLLDPFYEQMLQRQMSQPFNTLFSRQTSADEMVEWVSTHPPVPLRGMVFHMSRCGSTLIAQMLAVGEQNIVASEPGPLDDLLRFCYFFPDASPDSMVHWTHAMVAAISQPRIGGEKSAFLKMDSWEVHQIELLRAAFPDVPLIFLYRDPLEVMVSLSRMPALWAARGPRHPLTHYLQKDVWRQESMEEYAARAIASICEGGLRLAEQYGALLVNYNELPGVMFSSVFQYFGLTPEEMPAMAEKMLWDAKSPHAPFVADGSAKRQEASERIRLASEKLLTPLYERLQQARRNQVLAKAERS